MSSLYQIDQAILGCVDFTTGEIIDPELLDALHMERQAKIESVALWIKNLSSDAVAYKAEKEAFAEREKAAVKKIDQLKAWLAGALDGQKFTTGRCAVTFRRSEAVEIVNEEAIPKEYLTEKTTYSPNKTAIKEAIKAGNAIEGCMLVEKYNPTIK